MACIVRFYWTKVLMVAVVLWLCGVRSQGLLDILRQRTCNKVSPTAVFNLVAIPSIGKIDFMWNAPANRPCDVVYEVSITRGRGGNDNSIDTLGAADPTQTVNAPRATVTDVIPGYVYDISVRPVSPAGRGPAEHAAAVALEDPSRPDANTLRGSWHTFIAQEWTCEPIEGPALCGAAAAGQCTPIPCEDLARAGRCLTRELHVTDWGAKHVVQYCNKECGCPAVPLLRESLDDPRSDSCCAFKAGEYWIGPDGKITNGLNFT